MTSVASYRDDWAEASGGRRPDRLFVCENDDRAVEMAAFTRADSSDRQVTMQGGASHMPDWSNQTRPKIWLILGAVIAVAVVVILLVLYGGGNGSGTGGTGGY
jgi:hypothetical protein